MSIHPQVLFESCALMPEDYATRLYVRWLAAMGLDWQSARETGIGVPWLSFRFVPRLSLNATPVDVNVHVVPFCAPEYWAAIPSGMAKGWTLSVLRHALSQIDPVMQDVTVGFGGLTKNALAHGADFLDELPTMPHVASRLHSSHGDAGTAALVVAALRRIRVQPGDRVAVVGAAGVVGEAVARAVPSLLGVEHLLLVGNKDRTGQTNRKARLDGLAHDIAASFGADVVTGQDADQDCLAFGANIVVVATNGTVQVPPTAVPRRALVLDVTTPNACRPSRTWTDRDVLVLKAGCGEIDACHLPGGFGTIGDDRVDDIGAGGVSVIWGCLAETLARASLGWRGHLVGPTAPLHEVEWCLKAFDRLNITAQPPVMFGESLTWAHVGAHLDRTRPHYRTGKRPRLNVV